MALFSLKKRPINGIILTVKNSRNIIDILNKTIEWSLYILVFSIPFSKTVIEGCILIAFIAWVIKKILLKDFRLKKTPLNVLLFAFLAINIISFVNADFKLLFMRAIITKCLKFIILYFIVVETVDSKTKFKNLLIMASLSAVIVMIDSFLQHYFLHQDLIRLYPSFKFRYVTYLKYNTLGFPTGPFPFPNDLSAWMLIVLMPALCLFIRGVKRLRPRFILGTFLFPFLFLFYLTNARAAWLGFFASFFLILFIVGKKLFIVFVILFLVAAVILLFLPREKTINILGLSSLQDRFYMWRIGWKIFTEHPIIGNGLNMGFSKFQEYREDVYKNKKGSYFHNAFLQVAVETGIVGLLVFLLLIGKLLGTGLRMSLSPPTERPVPGRDSDTVFRRAFTLGLTGGLLAFLIHGFFDTNLQSLPLVILFWFSVGLLMSVPHIYAKKI